MLFEYGNPDFYRISPFTFIYSSWHWPYRLTLYCEINDGDIWRLEVEVLLPLILVLSTATSSIILFSAANTSFCNSIMAWCLISFIESSRKSKTHNNYNYSTWLHAFYLDNNSIVLLERRARASRLLKRIFSRYKILLWLIHIMLTLWDINLSEYTRVVRVDRSLLPLFMVGDRLFHGWV